MIDKVGKGASGTAVTVDNGSAGAAARTTPAGLAAPAGSATATVVRPEVLADGAAALAVAHALAPVLRAGASERDRHRLTPQPELDEIAASGLLGITVPQAFGGAGVSHEVLAEVMRALAEADPSVAQTLLPHFVLVGALSGLGSDDQQKDRKSVV